MGVLLYLFVPLLIVAAVATVMWYRNRQPTSLEAGVEAFRREMDALSPDAHLRRAEETRARQPRPGGGRTGPSDTVDGDVDGP